MIPTIPTTRTLDVDATGLRRAAEELADRCVHQQPLRHTGSLTVAVDGQLVFATGLHGQDLDSLVPTVASVTKSLLATVVGAAVTDGRLSLDHPIEDLLGDQVPPHRRGCTVEHLLTMTSGAAGGVLRIDEVMELRSSWVDALLADPQLDPPGAVFRYDNGGPHILSAALNAAVDGDLLGYATRVLTRCDSSVAEWPVDPEGIPFGFGDARMSPRQMLAFGEAWRTGTGVPLAFREAAWTAQTSGGPPEHRNYGYLWWVGSDAGLSSYLAAGWAGQCILIVPDLGLTVVATGDPAALRPDSRPALEEVPALVAAARG